MNGIVGVAQALAPQERSLGMIIRTGPLLEGICACKTGEHGALSKAWGE